LNSHQFRALVFDLVANEMLSSDSVFQRIRRDHRDDFQKVSRDELEGLITSVESEVKATTDSPLAEAFLFLVYGEISLRGDLADTLSTIHPKNPREVRTLVQLAAALGSRDNGGSHLAAPELVAAIQMLEDRIGFEPEVTNYQARLDALYPQEDKHDGE